MKGNTGVSATRKSIKRLAHIGYSAKRELVALGKKPKRCGRGRQKAIDRYAQMYRQGTAVVDFWYVLLEAGSRTPLKRAAMSRLEAWRRNKTLEGTGFSWALVNL
jgi:hypothetical protein